MLVTRCKIIPYYWDEGQKGPNYYHWYKKRFFKRAYRKKWQKERLKDFDKE